MAIGFGQPTPEEEALQDPDIQPSDAWNIPKGLAALGAMAPAAIIKLLHGTDKASARAIMQHGFDPAAQGKGADAGTAAQGWYGKGMYFTEDPKVAKEYAKMARTNQELSNPQLRQSSMASSEQIKKFAPTTMNLRNTRILETKLHDWDILDATAPNLEQVYKERLARIMTGTPNDGRDFIMRRQQWATSVIEDAQQQGKLGVKFSPNEVVIPDPRGLGFGERKVR